MKNLVTLILLLCAVAWAGDPPKRGKKRWLVSVAALVTAGVLDTHSSYGGYEANPLLRSSDGRLRVKGVAVKFGLLGATIATEHLILRKHPEAETTIVVANFASGAAITAVAVRNYRLRTGGAR